MVPKSLIPRDLQNANLKIGKNLHTVQCYLGINDNDSCAEFFKNYQKFERDRGLNFEIFLFK